ncbi:hypothetical protein PO587_12650 [Streptomyces gilvifuscus]|uniref:Cell wall protein n=1 Tax=Streptomyces gilvifuscus TaxID=1550617 RepID=A0ABT5FRZ4_9ACTN|nr:hypothetical protein [Streptomyces gilvifuscus]MDC2955312.1 hypothetical protein [Streptomyces gilvifuscus]
MTAGRASWGRFLGHGLLSGTAAFAVLVLVLGLLPVGDGWAGLLMYLALVVPPTLAARRFAPAAKRLPALPPAPGKKRPTAPDAAERAVTSYGELLRLETYRPGPGADPDDLAAYRTALDVYDEAKRSAPARVPELLERGRAALDRLDSARLAGTDITWIRGTGDTRVHVPAPGDGPALLVFETDDRHGGFRVYEGGGRGVRPRELFRVGYEAWSPVSGRARVLVPGRRGARLLLDVRAPGAWRIALRPPDEIRRLERELRGRGIETVLKDEGCRLVEFEHRARGPFALHELTRTHHTGRLLAEGHDSARLTVAVPECRRTLRVDATGEWRLRTPKGGHPTG